VFRVLSGIPRLIPPALGCGSAALCLWAGSIHLFRIKQTQKVEDSFHLSEHLSGIGKVITPHFEELIDRLVASGRFNNKSEVIRAGLRLLEEHEAQASAATREDLSRMIQTALIDPRPLIPATQLLRRRRRQ
jgi:antitoxin ParD1/3/4